VVVAPGTVAPAGGDHFRVFSPYLRRWEEVGKRAPLAAPRGLRTPSGVRKGDIPRPEQLVAGSASPELAPGGEQAARQRLTRWLSAHLASYDARRDDLAADVSSRLSPYLHFGCISPAEVVARASGRAGAGPFIRQICWRDFHHQVLAANPALPREDYRPRGDRWQTDPDGLEAWKEGRTGVPIVDAGMRQLAHEGFMHNRARLITASFLTKDLYIDWRLGARHFWDLLLDGDIANNSGNWQWVAGTGNDTRPNRVFNPIRQARRFDPAGDYVRRYVPELGDIEGPAVHEPWKLDPAARSHVDYPAPLVEHEEVAKRWLEERNARPRERT
jgi:deoxyribodipyrimidine photo-lyase